jgi:hypothetical protein
MFLKHLTPDRRRRKRQLLKTSVRVFTETGGIDAIGINISDVGMCLFTVANLPLGSRLQIELPSEQCADPIRVSGTVRHRALYLYGIEFLANSEPWSGSLLDDQNSAAV